ncbi:MAG: hypothetical protein ACRDK7_08820, partial [Solirubrobacteraceae bacterium]
AACRSARAQLARTSYAQEIPAQECHLSPRFTPKARGEPHFYPTLEAALEEIQAHGSMPSRQG